MIDLKIGEKYRCNDYGDVEILSLNHPTNKDACAVRQLKSNGLMWVDKSSLRPIPKDTSHLKGLFEELKVEIEKASSCDEYYGIVVVNSEDVEEIKKWFRNRYRELWDKSRLTRNIKLYVLVEKDKLINDLLGWKFTTCLFSSDSHKTFKLDSMIFMLSRLGSQSKYPMRFVYV